jgi:Family of unknown function (DUF5706)
MLQTRLGIRRDMLQYVEDKTVLEESSNTVIQNLPEASIGLASADDEKPKKKKKGRDKNLGRGIETLFRVTFQNNIQLSQLADGKASMLISINGVIISIVIALIVPRIQSLGLEFIPALVLLLGGMISLTFAIISSRPRLSLSTVSLEDIRANRASILFFGNFCKMPLPDFEAGMHMLMDDGDVLYDNMIRQIHAMGQVLATKYQLLKMAYLVFLFTIGTAVALMFGLVLLNSFTLN